MEVVTVWIVAVILLYVVVLLLTVLFLLLIILCLFTAITSCGRTNTKHANTTICRTFTDVICVVL